MGIHKRTYNRWKNNNNDYIDERTTCVRPKPANKLTKEERTKILETMNSEEFSSKAPSEVVLILADRGVYLASESTFYKVLKEEEELTHRGRSKKPVSRPAQRHEGKDKEILKQRHELYENAKRCHPERWPRETRNWEYQEEEWLNPERCKRINETRNQEVRVS